VEPIGADDLIARVLGLPARERARVAREVIASLDDGAADPDAERAWAIEIERRAREVIEGRARTVDARAALAKIRAGVESARGKRAKAPSRRPGARSRGSLVRGKSRPRR
jgi:hypothetical protein